MSSHVVCSQVHTWFEHDDTGDFFTETFVWKSEDGALVYLRKLINCGLNFGAIDIFASAEHHVLGAVKYVYKSVFVNLAEVTRT